ncbi:HK97 family phage prohead protease [Chitiniphilus eburneus]|uniref:HK97 family phage prohead protease n=1 Tax=Chitiniphilus eburneus TaxID=2571148 RepID=UPI0035CFAA07
MKTKSGAGMKIKDFPLEIKAVEEDGLFTGYGSVFGNVDSAREVVVKGAFLGSLVERSAKGKKLPILWQHRSGEPIGVYDKVFEDDHGLRVEGRLLVRDVQRAKEAHALMKAGAVSGLSIGYYVTDDSWDEKERIRYLKQLALEEVSLVTFPANDEARIDAIKSKLAHGGLPTLPEFEHLLREAGFSKTQAAVVANRGLKHLLDRGEPEGGARIGDALKALSEFII